MTTICADARAGVMAADSRLETGDVWLPCSKLERVPGGILGGAGDASQARQMADWLRSGAAEDAPEGLDDFEGLLLDSDGGLWLLIGSAHRERVERGFHAVGSGAKAALGAMMAGAEPGEAIRIAAEIDTATGGQVQTMGIKK